MSVYFFYGDEDYNIELEVNKLKAKLLDKNYTSMNFKTFDNPPFADLISYLRSQPMMFGNQIFVINCSEFFTKAWEDYQILEIEDALKNNAESLCIIFQYILPRGDSKKIDTRRKFYKILSKYSVVKNFPALKNYNVKELTLWLKENSKKFNISLDLQASNALIENIGANLRELLKELEKLSLIAYPEKLITKDMVKDICIMNEDIFTCTDCLLENKTDEALLEFRKLTDKRYPLEILSTIQTVIKSSLLMKLNSAKGKSAFEISKLMNMNEYRIKINLEKMKNISLKDLVTLKQRLSRAEMRIKSGNAIKDTDEIELAILG